MGILSYAMFLFFDLQVHVWGGISRRGATALAIFEGIMDSEFYQNILRDHLLPFIKEIYPDGHRFQQDNDPKHVSRSTLAWLRENDVNYWPTPPESPDCNPIENLWHQIKEHLRRHVKPSTKDELVNGIRNFWFTNLTPELCCRYIDHLKKVLPAVVEHNGHATGY
jgi:transposase